MFEVTFNLCLYLFLTLVVLVGVFNIITFYIEKVFKKYMKSLTCDGCYYNKFPLSNRCSTCSRFKQDNYERKLSK